MSTFGSSVINKSGKKLAPKAPAQRRRPGAAAAAAAPIPPSARASVERQAPSQTPQPPAVSAPSASPSAPEPVTVPSSQTAPHAPEPPTASTSKAAQPTSVSAAPQDVAPDSTPKSTPQAPVPRASEEVRPAPEASEAAILPTPPASDAVRPQSTDRETSTPSLAQQAPSEPEDQTVSAATAVEGPPLSETRRRRSSSVDAVPPAEPPAKRRKTKAAQPKPQPRRNKAPAPAKDTPEQTLIPTTETEGGVEATAQSATVEGTTTAPTKKQPKPRAPRKPRRKASDTAATEGDAADAATQSEAAPVKMRVGRRREPTPEDAEDTEIAPSEVKMADLCRDLRTGKKSQRESQLRKMDSSAASKRQKERKDRQESGEAPPSESVDQMLARAGRESGAISAPQMRIVNGQIVLDDQSLQIDRHANAAAGIDDADRNEIEENELTRKVNAGSWLKREKTEPWTEELTDLFYQGLRMFGTDFMMISKMFPGRTRRQIKLKFCKEERIYPQRINDALIGPRVPVDLAEYSELTNEEYADPQILQQELDEEAKAYEAEAAVASAKAAETLSLGVSKAFGLGEGGGDGSSAKNQMDFGLGGSAGGKANGKRGAGKKNKKKNLHSRNGGGEEVEILGSIEDFAQREMVAAEG